MRQLMCCQEDPGSHLPRRFLRSFLMNFTFTSQWFLQSVFFWVRSVCFALVGVSGTPDVATTDHIHSCLATSSTFHSRPGQRPVGVPDTLAASTPDPPIIMVFRSILVTLVVAVLSLPRLVASLQVTPGSPCSSFCIDSPELDETDPESSNTESDDITCHNGEFASTPKGQKFQRCMACLQDSSFSFGQESDQQWFLCMTVPHPLHHDWGS